MATKNSKKKSKNNKSNCGTKIIVPERYSLVFQRIASGKSYQETANDFNLEFGTKITLGAIYKFIHTHPDQYKEYLDKVKEVRLANAKARILDLQGLADKMRKKIEGEIDSMTPKLWAEADMGANIRELRGLYEQIAKDSGDRTDKGDKGGKEGHTFYVINHLPGVLANVNTKSSNIEGNRFKIT